MRYGTQVPTRVAVFQQTATLEGGSIDVIRWLSAFKHVAFPVVACIIRDFSDRERRLGAFWQNTDITSPAIIQAITGRKEAGTAGCRRLISKFHRRAWHVCYAPIVSFCHDILRRRNKLGWYRLSPLSLSLPLCLSSLMLIVSYPSLVRIWPVNVAAKYFSRLLCLLRRVSSPRLRKADCKSRLICGRSAYNWKSSRFCQMPSFLVYSLCRPATFKNGIKKCVWLRASLRSAEDNSLTFVTKNFCNKEWRYTLRARVPSLCLLRYDTSWCWLVFVRHSHVIVLEDTPSEGNAPATRRRIELTCWNFLGRVCSPRIDRPRDRRALDATETPGDLVAAMRNRQHARFSLAWTSIFSGSLFGKVGKLSDMKSS